MSLQRIRKNDIVVAISGVGAGKTGKVLEVIPERGEIWWVALDPALGSEIRKTRPCVVISVKVLNERRRTVIVVPLSSSPKASPPILIPISCDGHPAVAVRSRSSTPS